jgi:hypothetical protein
MHKDSRGMTRGMTGVDTLGDHSTPIQKHVLCTRGRRYARLSRSSAAVPPPTRLPSDRFLSLLASRSRASVSLSPPRVGSRGTSKSSSPCNQRGTCRPQSQGRTATHSVRNTEQQRVPTTAVAAHASDKHVCAVSAYQLEARTLHRLSPWYVESTVHHHRCRSWTQT